MSIYTMICLHFPWGNYCGEATIISPLNPPGIVNSERPCDALIVEVTGISVEYAKPPVNPIKPSELPVVCRELAICFQDLSTERSRVPPLHAGSSELTVNRGIQTVNYKTSHCWSTLIKRRLKVPIWQGQKHTAEYFVFLFQRPW